MDEISEKNLEELNGVVEDVLYYNDDNGYGVINLDIYGECMSVAGNLPFIGEGESVCVHGNWFEHPKYGLQFTSVYYEPKMVKDADSAYRYLAGGIIKGIGITTARKIVDKFQEKTFDIIEKDYDKLVTIAGITPKKARSINQEYMKKIEIQNVVSFFGKYDISPTVAVNAYNSLGMLTVSLCKSNPYILCERVERISFLTADKLADKIGISKNSDFRISAGIIYSLKMIALNGHTCYPKKSFIKTTSEMLRIDSNSVENGIATLIAENKIVLQKIKEETFISLPLYFDAEKYIAERILSLKAVKVYDYSKEADIENFSNVQLADEQKNAVIKALQTNMLIISGGPGTGKTTVIETIINAFEYLKKKIILAAPTGRAAKRISDLCGRNAKTIHRLLELKYQKGEKPEFEKNERNPLKCDVLIIDEMSMTDTLLFESLLLALRENVRIIMVGDCDQLPPVGAGNVLKDLLSSNLIEKVYFKEIFRQGDNSQIVENAHKVLMGQSPIYNEKNSDFFFVGANNSNDASMLINSLLTQRLPNFLNISSDKIQVLTPMRKTILGSKELNNSIKQAINPVKKHDVSKTSNGYVFSINDRVMQTKNDYDITWETKNHEVGEGIYNGDMGVITNINIKGSYMTIIFDDDKIVSYDFSKLDNLELSYAITVHKSQGSEFDAVIIPLVYGYNQLMNRNLLYTAITRGKKFVCIVGKKECVSSMVDNNIEFKRYTMLKEFLQVARKD